jgi:hypothetical protein
MVANNGSDSEWSFVWLGSELAPKPMALILLSGRSSPHNSHHA